jgi:hypothetical protein
VLLLLIVFTSLSAFSNSAKYDLILIENECKMLSRERATNSIQTKDGIKTQLDCKKSNSKDYLCEVYDASMVKDSFTFKVEGLKNSKPTKLFSEKLGKTLHLDFKLSEFESIETYELAANRNLVKLCKGNIK